MNFYKKKLEYILKHNLLFQNVYKFVFSMFFRGIGLLFKTDPNLVLINSFGGRKFNDSSKAIFEKMIQNGNLRHLQIVWAFEEPEKFDIPAKKVKIDTLQYFLIALKAGYWISNVNIERGLHFKKKQTRYLNTWHGTPLKLVGNAVNGRKDFKFSNVDIFCYAGQYEKTIYIRDFGVQEKSMVMCGLPRNDELYHINNDQISKLREKFNIPPGKKVILYAPTWRESSNSGKTYTLNPPIDIDLWRRELSGDYIIMFRTHCFTTDLLGLEFSDFITDCSTFPDINELMIVSDILISDYSATIFDYSILERPIISFAYDFETYKKNRGFYIDLENELPNGILKTQEQVIRKIKTMDYKAECGNTKRFKMKYIQAGGSASEVCIEKLFGTH